MGRQLLLDFVEQSFVHDRRLLSRQNLSLVCDLANEEAVAKEMRKRSSPEWYPTPCLAGAEGPSLRADVALLEITRQLVDPADFEIPSKNNPHALGLFFHNEKLAVLQLIAQRQGASNPKAFPLGRRNLVPDALRGNLTLELGKGQEHIESQAAHGGRCIELLRHGYK